VTGPARRRPDRKATRRGPGSGPPFAGGRRADHADGGFTIVEVLVATVVFAILATAFATTLSASLTSFRASKARTIAEGAASSQLEDARRLAYDDLGTIGGNPAGLMAPTLTVTNGGQILTVATRISYVNDPLPAAVGSETGANYKSVTVTVTLAGSTNSLAIVQTLVAPPTEPSRSKGLIKVQIIDDAISAPVVGAVVSLGSGPDAPISDTTDAAGKVSFAALEPTTASGTTSKYTVTVSAPGYQVFPEDLPPATAASTALTPGAIFNTVLRVFKPVTLNVHLATGAVPYTGAAATLTISSSRGAGTVAATGADTAVTAVAGSRLIPGVDYTVGASAAGGIFSAKSTFKMATGYPTTVITNVALAMATYPTGQIQVKLVSSTGTVIVGSSVVVTGGPGSIAATGVTASTGIATIVVPAGTTPAYAVYVPAQSIYTEVTGAAASPAVGATVSVTLTVPKA
jgi:prepilin-type N-terminal cleavage/methylation domain-containing protein